jgi:hypothetical protein
LPTVFRSGPYRFFFYSADANEPPHVHVERKGLRAGKFWLEPVRLERSGDFGSVEIRLVERLVRENSTLLLRKWHEYFGNATERNDGPQRESGR